jgi:predicted DNA-binding transcriptional regulator YafY
MSANLYQRLFWLINTIYSNRLITLSEINQKWLRSSLYNGLPLARKTFNNHKIKIEEIFDINIECNRSTNQYFISNEENIQQDVFRNWLLNGFAVSNTISESKNLKNRILFEHIPSGENHLTDIIEAMKSNKMIRLSYHSYWDDDSYVFDIEPYCLKIFKQRWYVVGKTNTIKIYALDRIANLIILQSEFTLPLDFDPEFYFAECYGIINDSHIKPVTICLRFEIKQAQFIRSLPLHKTQKETNRNNHTVDFEFYLKPTYDFVQEILKHGEFVEVIKPQWLRDEFKDKIRKMKDKY